MLKKVKENQVREIEELFNSKEGHIRKAVQMNLLAHNFAKNLELRTGEATGVCWLILLHESLPRQIVRHCGKVFGWLHHILQVCEQYRRHLP